MINKVKSVAGETLHFIYKWAVKKPAAAIHAGAAGVDTFLNNSNMTFTRLLVLWFATIVTWVLYFVQDVVYNIVDKIDTVDEWSAAIVDSVIGIIATLMVGFGALIATYETIKLGVRKINSNKDPVVLTEDEKKIEEEQ